MHAETIFKKPNKKKQGKKTQKPLTKNPLKQKEKKQPTIQIKRPTIHAKNVTKPK